MPACNTINPYPGLGTDGLSGQSYVSPGRVYSNVSPTGTTVIPTDNPYGNHYGTTLGTQGNYTPGTYSGVTGSSAAGATTMPLASINPSDFHEEYGSPLLPAEGAELYLSRMPTEKRTGLFQKVNFNALWTPKGSKEQDAGMTQLDASLSLAVPFFKADSPLVISPLFQAWLLDPKYNDFYPRKEYYTTGVDVRWIKPIISNKLTIDLRVTPLYSGTFKGTAKKALRFPAHLATIWTCNPRLKVAIGVAWLDREDDYNWMPMGGVIWTPNEDWNLELLIPRARIAKRIRWFGNTAGSDKSDWLYGGFEIATSAWKEHTDGETQKIDYSDLRAMIGYERRTAFGMTIAFEVGYMFNRKYEYYPTKTKIEPKDNVFLRLRTTF